MQPILEQNLIIYTATAIRWILLSWNFTLFSGEYRISIPIFSYVMFFKLGDAQSPIHKVIIFS